MTGADRTTRVKKPQGFRLQNECLWKGILRVGSLRKGNEKGNAESVDDRRGGELEVSSAHSLTNERRESFEPATGIEPGLSA